MSRHPNSALTHEELPNCWPLGGAFVAAELEGEIVWDRRATTKVFKIVFISGFIEVSADTRDS